MGKRVEPKAAKQSAEVVSRVIVAHPMSSLEDHALGQIQNWRDEDEAIVQRLRTTLTTANPLPSDLTVGVFAAHLVAATTVAALAQGANISLLFQRMFRTLPPARFDEKDLRSLASKIVAEAEAEQTPETEADAEENTGISAGYTYLGQFIDHDLTFDPASSLEKQNDPDALVDFRTPRFDLDNIYGRGPDDQPYLYEDGGRRMLLGRPLTGNPRDVKTRDLPRNSPASD